MTHKAAWWSRVSSVLTFDENILLQCLSLPLDLLSRAFLLHFLPFFLLAIFYPLHP